MNANLRLCCAVALVLVAFAFTLADATCFDMEKMKGDMAKCKGKGKEAAMKKCAEENPSNTEDQNKECVHKKFADAKEKCKDAEDKKKCWKDATGMDTSKFEMTHEQFEGKVLSYVTDSSKTDAIKTTLGECKDEKSFKKWFCAMDKLGAGPCPEMKEVKEKMQAEWAKKKEAKEAKKNKE